MLNGREFFQNAHGCYFQNGEFSEYKNRNQALKNHRLTVQLAIYFKDVISACAVFFNDP